MVQQPLPFYTTFLWCFQSYENRMHDAPIWSAIIRSTDIMLKSHWSTLRYYWIKNYTSYSACEALPFKCIVYQPGDFYQCLHGLLLCSLNSQDPQSLWSNHQKSARKDSLLPWNAMRIQGHSCCAHTPCCSHISCCAYNPYKAQHWI